MSEALLRALRTIASFFPPDLSLGYLRELLLPIAQTLATASAGMLIAFVCGIPLAIVIGTRLPGYRVVIAALSALRAIPDLTLAILAVVVVGLGPPAGVLALALFYTAMIGRVFGDLFLSAPAAPLEALRATGASRVAIAVFGFVPLVLDDLLTFGAYAFECAMRASIVIGAVGAGGIGTELLGALDAFAYGRALTLILVVALLVSSIDAFGALVRRVPRLGLLLVPAGLGSIWWCRPQFFAASHASHVVFAMFPPRLRGAEFFTLPMLLVQTLAMALGGTLLGALLAFPLSLAGTRRVAPPLCVFVVRRLLDGARAIPELVWGLVLVVCVGIGPLAGALALGFHSAGVLGKLYAESFENAPRAPVEALAATGARTLPTVAFGYVPLALGALAVHTLFRLEWNVRAAALVGMIGAGGIGQALYEAQQLFFYHEMLAYVLVTWGLVALSDVCGERLRVGLGLRFVTE